MWACIPAHIYEIPGTLSRPSPHAHSTIKRGEVWEQDYSSLHCAHLRLLCKRHMYVHRGVLQYSCITAIKLVPLLIKLSTELL